LSVAGYAAKENSTVGLIRAVLVKLSGGRIVEATIKAVVETTEGVRLQVSFGNETALIYSWQMVSSDA
jgi:hypothetical protein